MFAAFISTSQVTSELNIFHCHFCAIGAFNGTSSSRMCLKLYYRLDIKLLVSSTSSILFMMNFHMPVQSSYTAVKSICMLLGL